MSDFVSHYRWPQNYHTTTRHPNRAQLSPNFRSRSSPIAIIHNPEDNANQAKLRWQHPMYDTSDDEGDDDISVESLTLPLTSNASRNSAPKSLPTTLLRAPKLGSLPSQEYLLLHLAKLPPPMSLSGDPETTFSKKNTANTAHMAQGSYGQKPKYLSSYGSLRESHLTGRFGGASGAYTQTHTGLLQNPGPNHVKVRFHCTEPPDTLIPPRHPESNILQLPQKKHAPSENLSIRDRMIQKAEQQKDEASKDAAGGEKKITASSLSTILANENNSTGHSTSECGIASPRSPVPPQVLPASMANAVAISYNSNRNRLAWTGSQLDLRQRRNSEQLPANHHHQEEQANTVLSSSLTGLEILRASSMSRPTVRATSLSIFQGSSGAMHSAPPATTHGAPTCLLRSQMMSEPSRHASSIPHSIHQEQGTGHRDNGMLNQEFHKSDTSLAAPTMAQKAWARRKPHNPSLIGVVRTTDGRTLIPPKSPRGPSRSSLSTLKTKRSLQVLPQPEPPHGLPSLSGPVPCVAPAMALMDSRNMARGNTIADTQPFVGTTTSGDELNPDTEEAFDMDLD